MNEPQQSGESGWTAAKVAGLIVGLLLMVGFGACGLFGLAINFSYSPGDPAVYGLSLAGLAIATGGFFLARKMVRLARGPARNDP